MQDRTHARDREVGLDVLLVVEAEGRDTVAPADAEPGERRGELLGAVGDLGEARAAEAVALEGHDLALPVDLPAVAEDVPHEKRPLLHGASHRRAPPCLRPC